MSMDGVVPPPGGPTRRPAGGPDEPGRAAPTDPATPPAAGRNPAAAARSLPARPAEPVSASTSGAASASAGRAGGYGTVVSDPCDFDRLGDALRSRVAAIGTAGPPPGGLARIRRGARIRQRNRAALVGSAGVLIIAIAVTLATGDRFNIVPTLTGTAGNGGGAVAGGDPGGASTDRGTAAAGNGGRVIWPTGGAGKTGPAIGPVSPVTTTPPAAVAAKVPLCSAASVTTSTTLGPTMGGVVYGHVNAVAQSPCVVVGPPVLEVTNQAGTAAGSVLILKEDTSVAPALPKVSTWGTTMVLATGQSYEFQFAWAVAQCPQASASASPGASTAQGATTYTLGYAVTGTTPTAQVTLTAACGADVFVTDIYRPGAYPLPTVASQSPPPSTSATPDVGPTTTTPVTPSSSAPATSSSASPPPSPSSSPSSAAAGTVGIAGSPSG